MEKRQIVRNISLLIAWCLLAVSFAAAQSSVIDSVMKVRQQMVSQFDSSRMATPDTSALQINATLDRARQIISFDNALFERHYRNLKETNDSILRNLALRETIFHNQENRLKMLNEYFLVAAGAGALLFLLWLIFLIVWWRRGKTIRRFSEQFPENERLINEYRKRLNELQSDLENCRTQAKGMANENARQAKELGQMMEQVYKAREAGWSSTEGQPSATGKIRSLENKLSEELSKRRILEEELMLILRKLRGEEE